MARCGYCVGRLRWRGRRAECGSAWRMWCLYWAGLSDLIGLVKRVVGVRTAER